MSKIALSPDAAGTGTFTLASPNLNTNRTITLPDATGTLVASDASGNVDMTGTLTSGLLTVSGTYDTVLDGNSVQFNRAGPSYIQNNTAGGYTVFQQASGEAMRITSAGDLLAGTTTAYPGAGVTQNKVGVSIENTYGIHSSADGQRSLLLNRMTSNGTLAEFRKDATTVGSVSVTGSATAYNTSSDYRLKTDAQPMTGASARVQELNPVNFEWIADGTRVDGFLAHEAQAVVPEAVHGTKDAMRDEEYEVTPAVEATYDDEGNELTAAVEAVMGTRSVPDYQGIDQSKLVPLLTAALQEALTKIDDMETRLAALEVTP